MESAPLAALYALVVQRFIHRDLPTNADVVRVMGDCATLVGGVLLILAVASGLTQYFVDAQITTRLADWMTAHVSSPIVFLLCLNLFLLLVGTVMDIFSAIVVVVPLILLRRRRRSASTRYSSASSSSRISSSGSSIRRSA